MITGLAQALAPSEPSGGTLHLDLAGWHWPFLLAVLAGLLLVDLFVVNREAHEIQSAEAVITSVVWVGIGLSFSLFMWWQFGSRATGEYLGGYLIEKSLSIDNVFVWAVIFSHFAVPRQYQHRTLFWGIFGALVMRFAFIAVGTAVINRFAPLLLVFGLFLIYTGWKIVSGKDEESDPNDTRTMRLFRRFVPSVDHYDGQNMITKVDGKRFATPLLAVLVIIEVSDVIFAVDSVPAVLAVSHEQFIVFASNAWAILGLRALYFLLADMRERFIYMPQTISALLIFVGAKMTAAYFGLHISVVLSLAVIVGFLATGVAASIVADRRGSRGSKSPN